MAVVKLATVGNYFASRTREILLPRIVVHYHFSMFCTFGHNGESFLHWNSNLMETKIALSGVFVAMVFDPYKQHDYGSG